MKRKFLMVPTVLQPRADSETVIIRWVHFFKKMEMEALPQPFFPTQDPRNKCAILSRNELGQIYLYLPEEIPKEFLAAILTKYSPHMTPGFDEWMGAIRVKFPVCDYNQIMHHPDLRLYIILG